MSVPEIDAFLEMLVAERGAAGNTISAYRRDLLQFADFLKASANQTIFSKVTSDQVHQYLMDLSKQGRKATTLSRHLSALRQFYQFLVSEGWVTENPTASVEAPRHHRSLPKILSEDEISKLLQIASTQSDPEGIRLYAMLEVLYATGLRVSELISLPYTAIDLKKPVLLIKGKGNKERMVILSEPALNALQAYVQVRSNFLAKARINGQKWLFPSISSEGHLTRQRFGQLLKELALAAQLDTQKLSPHVVRHAFATHLLRHGADLLAIQKLLGHADLSTTQIYTHIVTDRLKELVNDHHPLAMPSKDDKIHETRTDT
jgi:integrase/recombinase XerD